MNWDDFDAFCQVVEHGGFTAAARALERPKSSLSASVARLEERVGTRLLERTTRSLRLTEAGESLYRDISRPFSQLRELAVDAMARGAQVQGTLRMAAPYEFGAHHLAGVACKIMAGHPQLKVHIDVEHARVALFERHYDIVFSPIEHAFAPSSIVTRRVFSLERGLFAAPSLLSQFPELASPGDLNGLPLLAGADDVAWEFSAPDGGVARLDVRNPRMRSGNAGVRLEAALAGLGVARITETFCAPAVAQGRLVPLLPAWLRAAAHLCAAAGTPSDAGQGAGVSGCAGSTADTPRLKPSGCDEAPAVQAARRCRAKSTYQSRHPGLAIASLLTTFSSGSPSSSFLIGSSCFLPDSVRGISAT